MKYEVDARFTVNCNLTVEAETTAQAKELIRDNCTAYGGLKATDKAKGLIKWSIDKNTEICLGKARKDHEITESIIEPKEAV